MPIFNPTPEQKARRRKILKWVAIIGAVVGLAIGGISALAENPPKTFRWEIGKGKRQEKKLAVIFSCTPPTWNAGPIFEDADLVGTAESVCQFEGEGRGDFGDLFERLSDDTSDKADKVHSGPDLAKVDGRDGVRYDITRTYSAQKEKITIRADVFIGWGEDSVIATATSKSVVGTGVAKNIKEVSPEVVIMKNGNKYLAKFRSKMRVTKPPAVPKNKFIQIVGKQVDLQMKERHTEMVPIFVEVLR